MKKKIIVPTALLLIISLFANTAVFAAPMPSTHAHHNNYRAEQPYPHNGNHHHYPPRTSEHHRANHAPQHYHQGHHHSHSDTGTIVAASIFGVLAIGLGIAAAVSD